MELFNFERNTYGDGTEDYNFTKKQDCCVSEAIDIILKKFYYGDIKIGETILDFDKNGITMRIASTEDIFDLPVESIEGWGGWGISHIVINTR